MPFPTNLASPLPPASSQPPGQGKLLALQGVSLLAVEDSRFASDALRLMCQRSGARLRRAEGLAQARSCLRVFRPDVVLVDIGLPDGPGDALIAELAATPHAPVILGMSGDPDGRTAALAAGAAGFLDKPIPCFAAFIHAILTHLHGADQPWTGVVAGEMPPADRLALHDDLHRIATALRAGPGPQHRVYLARFLTGIARQTGDTALGTAAQALLTPDAGLAPLKLLIEDRLAACPAFADLG